MKQVINFSQFVDSFRDAGRENQFTYNGKRALYDWFEQYEEDCNEEIELDVIAICCEYAEYSSLEELKADYSIDGDFDEVINELENNTQVVSREEDCILIAQY